MSKNRYSSEELLYKLNQKGFLEDKKRAEELIIERNNTKKVPLYIEFFLGFGAFVAACFLLAFLIEAEIITPTPLESQTWGLAFIASAIGIKFLVKDQDSVKNCFLVQSSLALMILGKILAVYGFWTVLERSWVLSISIFIVTGLTYFIYPMAIDRFLSILALLIALQFDISSANNAEVLFHSFFIIQIIIAAILLNSNRIKHDNAKMAYAFVFSLCLNTLFLSTQRNFSYQKFQPIFASFALAIALVSLIAWLAGDFKKLKSPMLIIALTASILLGIISAPGIILSIILLTLGYAKHDRILTIMGIILLPLFLFTYYYSLDISFIQKSILLLGSGILLIMGSLYAKQKKGVL